MAVSVETQRLISVSLGKIAQSRGQRGGINLHKNLLVATVLHKARTAYMMESYNYQQNLHRQKLLEHYQLQQQNLHSLGQKLDSSPLGESNKGDHPRDVGPLTRDSNLGHTTSTAKTNEQTTRSEVSSFSGTSLVSHEHVPVQDCQVEIVRDKENSPPVAESCSVLTDRVLSAVTTHVVQAPQDSHLQAATLLSQEVQMASSEHCARKQSTSSGGTTCSMLKRRRDSRDDSSQHDECSLNKVAKINYYYSHSTPKSDYSQDSLHESQSQPGIPHSQPDIPHSQPDIPHSQPDIPHSQEHHQISSLVSVFNSGFSGLCVNPSSDVHTVYQSDFSDISMSLSRNITIKAG